MNVAISSGTLSVPMATVVSLLPNGELVITNVGDVVVIQSSEGYLLIVPDPEFPAVECDGFTETIAKLLVAGQDVHPASTRGYEDHAGETGDVLWLPRTPGSELAFEIPELAHA